VVLGAHREQGLVFAISAVSLAVAPFCGL